MYQQDTKLVKHVREQNNRDHHENTGKVNQELQGKLLHRPRTTMDLDPIGKNIYLRMGQN